MPPRDDHDDDRMHILMAVFNGAETLPAQLDSITAQTHPDWRLLAGDDGSTDDSRAILTAFRDQHPPSRIEVIDGPRTGASNNFLGLLRHLARADSDPHWIAFSDQDDVWLPDKITRAMNRLRACDPTQPALYCSRTWVTCNTLSTRRLSAPRPRTPDFRNALVQNIAAGNTIVLNPAAVRLVLDAVQQISQVVVHDWWLYQLITGVGGQVIHDDTPGVLYRQHGANQIGVNDTVRARIRRFLQLLRGDFRAWNKTNIAALRATAALLRPDHRAQLDAFARLSTLPLFKRLSLLRQLGLYRQTPMGTLSLWFAVVFRLV